MLKCASNSFIEDSYQWIKQLSILCTLLVSIYNKSSSFVIPATITPKLYHATLGLPIFVVRTAAALAILHPVHYRWEVRLGGQLQVKIWNYYKFCYFLHKYHDDYDAMAWFVWNYIVVFPPPHLDTTTPASYHIVSNITEPVVWHCKVWCGLLQHKLYINKITDVMVILLWIGWLSLWEHGAWHEVKAGIKERKPTPFSLLHDCVDC